MEESLFRRLLPVFKKTSLVHLQGWGDPFTHTQFFHFARLAKLAGCQVGTTSNGMLVNKQMCAQLVEERIDTIGLSIAGTGAENDAYRRGTRLEKVLSVVECIQQIKQRTGADRPHVHIAYMLLKSGRSTVGRLPEVLRGRGIDQVVISVLDTVGSPALARETISPEDHQGKEALRQQLEVVVEDGRKVGLTIHYRLPAYPKNQEANQPHLEDASLGAFTAPHSCSENVQRAAFIGVTGKVSPCVFVNLPLTDPPPSPCNSLARPYHPLVFGTIATTRFEKIWHAWPYASFRQAHHTSAFPPDCQTCTKFPE
jgi:MoaA/NifB/PqqE/SkfB family radical SAM enzyme